MTPRPIIHFGIHKTASTFLQSRFFPGLAGIRYLPLRAERPAFLEAILRTDALEFDPAVARAALAPPPGEGPLTISDEQFYGLVWDGAQARAATAERLAAALPGARALLVLRNQPAQLQSLYMQYVKTGGTAEPAAFLAASRHPLRIASSYFRYAPYVEHLRRLFGAEAVRVLLYEDLRRAPEAFLDGICDFIGVDRSGYDRAILGARDNLSLSPRLAAPLRLVNALAKSERNPQNLLPRGVQTAARRALVRLSDRLPRTFAAGPQALPAAEVERFLVGCAEDNRRLAALLDRDLSGLGYPL